MKKVSVPREEETSMGKTPFTETPLLARAQNL
jgi:hypothetical protein